MEVDNQILLVTFKAGFVLTGCISMFFSPAVNKNKLYHQSLTELVF